MSLSLIIECGVAQTRAALLDDDKVIRFWFGSARGDELSDNEPLAGHQFIGRVRIINASLKAAFVDIGGTTDGFLNLNKTVAAKITEGALIAVTVKSPPRQDKGAVVKFVELVPTGEAIGRRPPVVDAALEAVAAIGDDAEIIIADNGLACAALKKSNLTAEIIHDSGDLGLFEKYEIAPALEIALGRCVEMPGGGTLVIDEGQALTAIDVDSAGLTASSSERLREKMAIAAAYEAVHQISIRNIGGHVVVDFPPITGEAARKRFNDELKNAMKLLPDAGGIGFSKSGLFSFTLPQRAQSLQERFTELAVETSLPVRKFTTDYQAKRVIQYLENRLLAAPRVVLELKLGTGLQNYIKSNEIWLNRLIDRYGARFEISVDEKLEDRTFELCEQ